MDDSIKEFVNPDQPFGPITAPTIKNYEAFSPLFDSDNAIARELNKRPAWIIGRRGAGKTAFLNSLSLDPKYDVIVPLQASDAFPSMLRSIEQQLPHNILAEETARLWHNLLWGAVFQELLTRHRSHPALLPVARYLEGLGVTATTNLYAVMRAILNAIAALNRRVKILTDAIEDLTSRGITFRAAQDCAEQFLRARGLRAIILMDSLEQFPLDEPAMAKAMTGLLSCVGQFNQPDCPCEIRCCLPSELYPRLINLAANPLKDLSSRTILQWRPHELLHLAALRYLHFVRAYDFDAYRRYFAALDISKRDGLRDFWTHVLPDTVTNRTGGIEDSVAYLMRHTQLLPRHLLLYLNEVSKKALSTNGKAYRFCPSAVVEGICGSEHMLCKEIFSGFRQVYPNAEKACNSILPNLSITFKFGDLHRAFNRNRRGLEDFEDHHEVLSILLRIGAIGVVASENERYTEAIFDYTLPDNLHYRADDSFCVHPIFVEEYRVIDRFKDQAVRPVYPSGSEVTFDVPEDAPRPRPSRRRSARG
jgi:hypothetical protein